MVTLTAASLLSTNSTMKKTRCLILTFSCPVWVSLWPWQPQIPALGWWNWTQCVFCCCNSSASRLEVLLIVLCFLAQIQLIFHSYHRNWGRTHSSATHHRPITYLNLFKEQRNENMPEQRAGHRKPGHGINLSNFLN